MTDALSADEAAPESTSEAAPRGRVPLWPFVLILILILLGLAAWGGWRGWNLYQGKTRAQQTRLHTLETKLSQTRAGVDNLRAQVADARKQAGLASSQLSTLQAQQSAANQRLTRLDEAVHGGRRQVQLEIIEQLLLLANDETQLAADPVAADRALAAADRRLAALSDPDLFGVRKAIAEERSALQAVKSADITGVALALQQLIAQVQSLPLRTHPKALPAATPPAKPGAQQGWWTRALDKIGQSLRSLFRIHHNAEPVKPMLPEREAALVGAVLNLRLDGARAALIRRNGAVFQSELTSAQAWLRHYYDGSATTVVAMNGKLSQLAVLDLAPKLPDISASLELLRKKLGAAGASIQP